MVLAQPVQRVRVEEVPHLVAAEIEDERAPVGMGAAARIRVLVQRRAVEARERPLVAREVRRHPVEHDADAAAVQPVDERAEVVRRAEARGRREVAGHLVAPGAAERMLHHRQQLDVREAEVGDVVGQLVGQLAVGELAVALERIAAPRAEVDLVDRHRRAQRLGRARAAPATPSSRHSCSARWTTRRVLRRHLGGERDRVGLQAELAVLPVDLELVALARSRRRGRTAPRCRTRRASASGAGAASQALKSPTTRDRARVRRPDRERVPATPSISRTCAPSRSYSCSWRPSQTRCRSSSPSVGGNAYGSRSVNVSPSG